MEAIHLPERFVNSHLDLSPTILSPPQTTPSSPVLVKVTHAALNYVDILYARGKHQNNKRLVKPPFTLGLEFAGIVLDAPQSSGLSPIRPGDQIFGAVSGGAFAELVVSPLESLRKVPLGWSPREAAGVAATFPVSYGALVRCAKIKPNETVLVHAAAGGLGVAACQIAKAIGARVIATVGSEEKAHFVREVLGVDDVINYSQSGWESEILHRTGGKTHGGVDVVFDSVGLVEESIRCAKYQGRIIVVGFTGRDGNLEKLAVNRILLKAVAVVGYVSKSNSPLDILLIRCSGMERKIDACLALLTPSGESKRPGIVSCRCLTILTEVSIRLDTLIRRKAIRPVVYPQQYKGLRSVPVAMQAMLDRKIYGKAVIEVDLGAHGSKI